MRRLLAIAFLVALVAPGPAQAAGKGDRADLPDRYQPHALDAGIVRVQNHVDGRAWSAWSYRNGAEYDIALSVGLLTGGWSEPLLIGADDGFDQSEPALAVDARGATYVAFNDGGRAIRLAALQPGTFRWSDPIALVSGDGLASPALTVVGNNLVVAYRQGPAVRMAVIELLPTAEFVPQSIYDGPDPTGSNDHDDEDDGNQNEQSMEDFLDDGNVIPVTQGGRRGRGSHDNR